MKTLRLILVGMFVSFGASVMSQNLILSEDFQGFKEQGLRAGSDTLACGKKKVDSKANFKVSKVYGGVKVNYEFLKSAVQPQCAAKKSPAQVTPGLVEITKKEDASMVIGTFDYVSKIEVGASATGDVRGCALYKSVDGGAWVKVGEYIGSKAEGADAQYGFNSTININEKNVKLKFGPTVCGKDEPALQTFRIHDIKVYGK